MRGDVMYAIFMYLHKVYNALYRFRCLEILEGYGMVPWDRRILQEYWENLWMVAHAEGYYGVVFKSFRGVTQVESLPPTILMWWWKQWCITGYSWWKG